jgi:hypothetical protein
MKLCVRKRASHNESEPSCKPRYASSDGQGVEISEASSGPARTIQRRAASDGVKGDGAFGKFCQELGRPVGQHRRESEEAVRATKRVMTVEQRASA